MNFFKLVREYFTESIEEVKKVKWPTREVTVEYATLVVGLTVVFAAFFGLTDYIFSYLLGLIIS
jgi:preprotein translocase SecE subunit